MEIPAVVYCTDPVRAAVMGQEYRRAFRAAILEHVPPHIPVIFSRTSFLPAIAGWDRFQSGEVRVGGLERVSAAGRAQLFKNDSHKTEAEKSGGRLPGISRAGAGPTEIFSATELRALFYEQILPAQLESSSRKSYWGTWQLVLSWGLAHGIMDQLLPMSLANLEALIMELMILGMAANSIKNMMACIQSRHRMSELTPPILRAKLFARIFKAVASTTGAPSRLRFPIGTHQLLQMVALDGSMSPLERRAVLVVLIGTACVSRVDEVAQLQVCDLLWNHDAAYHPSLWAALAIRIIRRKQDSGRFGLYVRLPAGMVVEMLRAYVKDMQLRLDPRCTKAIQRGARCPFCDPVWPRTVVGRRAKSAPGQLQGMSRQQVSGAVKIALESIGVDAKHYSGISMRRGGVTAAVQAKIPPAILHLQSGHGTATSSMGYVDPVDPRTLYQTAAAILGLGASSP